MTLKQIFVKNLKEFRKKEGFSQMKLAEHCDTETSYVGHIESGRKFPSMEMIEKMAKVLKIEPYHFFINRTEQSNCGDNASIYPVLPKSMKNEIETQMELSISSAIKETLDKY